MTPDPSASFSAWALPFQGATWRDVVRRSDVLPHLDRTVLLHAGPPFEGLPPAPVRQAAAQALIFEGLAPDMAGALAMLSMGEVQLMPAQDHGVATPLAQVVSASMPLAVVGDGATVAYAPLVEGPPPALRFGSDAPEALARLHEVAALGWERIAPGLRRQPMALGPVVAQALAQGDECHGRTGAANLALVAAMPWLNAEDRALLQNSPGFVLPILMAAACWRLRSASTGIAAAGGNGLQFGLRMHGEAPWRAATAQPPRGTRMPPHAFTIALGAIGDSAVIDFCGLGGQALAAAPALCEEWRAMLPEDVAQRRQAIVNAQSGLVDTSMVHAVQRAPLVNLAILDRDGVHGLVGRGYYEPALALFAPAMQAARGA